jgi:DNA-binding transcriptional LysR family regulator
VHLLAVFRKVIESGSFSGAATEARVSQPAISQQMRQLEQQIGAKLIERIGRRATTTAAGAQLLANAEHVERAVNELRAAMAPYTNRSAGRIRIGTGATASIFLLPPILGNLRRHFPETEITVSTGNTSDIVKAVEDNRLDIAVVTLPASGRSLAITPVINDEFVLVGPPGARLPPRVTPQILVDHPLLLFEPAGNTRRIADQWFAAAGTYYKPAMSLGSVEAIKELVAEGLGYAILPRMAVENSKSNLAIRPLSPKLQRQLAIVVRRDRPLSQPMRELSKALSKGDLRVSSRSKKHQKRPLA